MSLLRLSVRTDGTRAAVRDHDDVAYRFVEHVGEVEVELEAATVPGIFEAGAAALAELLDHDSPGEPASHEVELEGHDHALLLVDWLTELVFLAEVAGFVPDRVTFLELADSRLQARLAGHRSDHPRYLVKAVTLNKLELEQEGGAWHGRVVLDV